MKTAAKLITTSLLSLMLNAAYAQSDMQPAGSNQDTMKTNRSINPERTKIRENNENDSMRTHNRTMPNNRMRRDSANTSPENKMYKRNPPATVPPDSTHK